MVLIFFFFFLKKVMIDNFGHTTYVDLKEGGSEIPVTKENRQEYVDLYVSYYLNHSIAKQFEFVGKLRGGGGGERKKGECSHEGRAYQI